MESDVATRIMRRCVLSRGFLLFSLTALIGCNTAMMSKSEGPLSLNEVVDTDLPNLQNLKTIDAGIVFFDRSSYSCLSMKQVGLTEDVEVISLQCSCECVKPRLIEYLAEKNRTAKGIMLEFSPELDSDKSDLPMNLGICVDIGLADGKSKQVTVNLLHTDLVNTISFN